MWTVSFDNSSSIIPMISVSQMFSSFFEINWQVSAQPLKPLLPLWPLLWLSKIQVFRRVKIRYDQCPSRVTSDTIFKLLLDESTQTIFHSWDALLAQLMNQLDQLTDINLFLLHRDNTICLCDSSKGCIVGNWTFSFSFLKTFNLSSKRLGGWSLEVVLSLCCTNDEMTMLLRF